MTDDKYQKAIDYFNAAKEDQETPRTFCVTEDTWKSYWSKCIAEKGTIVYIVANNKELPTKYMDWARICFTAPFYYESDGKQWIKRKEIKNLFEEEDEI